MILEDDNHLNQQKTYPDMWEVVAAEDSFFLNFGHLAGLLKNLPEGSQPVITLIKVKKDPADESTDRNYSEVGSITSAELIRLINRDAATAYTVVEYMRQELQSVFAQNPDSSLDLIARLAKSNNEGYQATAKKMLIQFEKKLADFVVLLGTADKVINGIKTKIAEYVQDKKFTTNYTQLLAAIATLRPMEKKIAEYKTKINNLR